MTLEDVEDTKASADFCSVAYMSFLAISVPEQYPAAVRERERGDSHAFDNTMVPIDNPRRQFRQAV
jgi:hypothetical protein